MSHCDGPEDFGICDPYVLGTIISLKQKQPIRVIRAWHDGLAEQAGAAEQVSDGFLTAEHFGFGGWWMSLCSLK